MRITSISGQIDPQLNPFAESYIREIVRAITMAWSRMRNPPANKLEDQITFSLAARLQNDTDLRELPFDVVPQYWLLDLEGRRLGRLDLYFKYRQSHRDYFAFEAKRLHMAYRSGFKTEHSVYVGDEGMMCYATGQYATGLPHAGMLAYVMDNNVSRAWDGVSVAIEKKRDLLRLRKETKFTESVFDKMTTEIITSARVAETTHDFDTRQMVIAHLLLPRET